MTAPWLRRLTAGAATLGAAVLTLAATIAPAAADTGSAPLSHSTVVGVHNTYDDGSVFPHLANALDTGTSMIELDTWTDVFTTEWKVSHSNPLGNNNNCVDASKPADIYTGSANKDLGSCLDDVKYWLASHTTTGPLYIKLELKQGFEANSGLGRRSSTR